MLILIVEDEPIVALNLIEAIEAHGHQVLGAVSTRVEVTHLLRIQHPDLALVDINLHGETGGIDIAHRLTHNFAIPTIFLSGQQQLARANQDAALGLIEKPFLAEQVADCIDAYASTCAGEQVSFPKVLELFH